ncbi:hypothetical protein AVEN_11057-1 [Araneus ventricosus]|uniref:Mutator-like transposase domain-containing protein n=1 Tax=Araneus ventricosus TaxID=182803 RepID=A0A4Y2AGG5_ARAVE|nr:hypothetical protein AVEN_11057-1 [Araneus ventricosus]
MLFNIRKDVKEAYGSRNDNDVIDIGVSYDGSWLTRAHTSNIRIGCVIDLLTGFVIDFQVCQSVVKNVSTLNWPLAKMLLNSIFGMKAIEIFAASHMSGHLARWKSKAAIKLWERSESIGFRYTSLLSDGDSKAFLELNERKIYGSQVEIKKEECINHVSKRLGTALRKTVKDWRVKGVTFWGKQHGS